MTLKMHQTASKLLYKSRTEFIFHAHVKIKIPLACPDHYLDILFDEMKRVDEKFNSYAPGSVVSEINSAAGQFISIDKTSFQLLQWLKQASEAFNGAYDITIMPLLRLWGFYRDKVDKEPEEDEIIEVLKRVGYENLELEPDRAKIPLGFEIITGSFLKAYAVDQVFIKLRELNIDDALINAGGSTIACINPTDNPHWTVQIPLIDQEEKTFKIQLSNNCISTSSSTHNFLEIGHKSYAHILNAQTGNPSENKLVSVLHKSCFWSDVLSTGLFAIDSGFWSKTLNKLSNHYGFRALLQDQTAQQYFYNGFEENRVEV